LWEAWEWWQYRLLIGAQQFNLVPTLTIIDFIGEMLIQGII
jgi:hypothetical protein